MAAVAEAEEVMAVAKEAEDVALAVEVAMVMAEVVGATKDVDMAQDVVTTDEAKVVVSIKIGTTMIIIILGILAITSNGMTGSKIIMETNREMPVKQMLIEMVIAKIFKMFHSNLQPTLPMIMTAM